LQQDGPEEAQRPQKIPALAEKGEEELLYS
jgi:hypothetical protein